MREHPRAQRADQGGAHRLQLPRHRVGARRRVGGCVQDEEVHRVRRVRQRQRLPHGAEGRPQRQIRRTRAHEG